MRVHHLNCATICPVGGPLVGSGRFVCHCLLVESSAGLVLVDTGLGSADIRDARGRLGRLFVLGLRPACDPAETAVSRVRALGFSPKDVRHVVVTHLDVDHAGGLPDFPGAEVHVFAPELEAAKARATFIEKMRYLPAQWAHGPKWRVYDLEAGGDRWSGFERVRPVEGLGDALFALPLVGHTRGHVGVGVAAEDGLLLHAGDAYFSRLEMEGPAPRCPVGLELFQRHMAVDGRARLENRERLRALVADPGSGARVFCAHDPAELERLSAP